MKKFISLLITLLLITSLFAGCQLVPGSNAYKIYNTVQDSLGGMTSIDMDLEAKCSINVDGEVMPVNMTGNIKQVMKSETDIDMEMIMSTQSSGETVDIKAYYTDGSYYTEVMGQKIKMPMDLEEATKQANTTMPEFPVDAVKDSVVTKTDNGKLVSFTIDYTYLKDYLESSVSGMLSSIGSPDDFEFSFNDVKFDIFVDKDNNFDSMNMIFDMTMVAEGQEVTMEYDMLLKLNSFNDVVINFPADLDTYQEISYQRMFDE